LQVPTPLILGGWDVIRSEHTVESSGDSEDSINGSRPGARWQSCN
jgi:hypothetical protein